MISTSKQEQDDQILQLCIATHNVLVPNVPAERPGQITAREVVAGKIKHETRKSYNKKIGVFNVWLGEFHPDFYDIGAKSQMLPVPADIVVDRLGGFFVP